MSLSSPPSFTLLFRCAAWLPEWLLLSACWMGWRIETQAMVGQQSGGILIHSWIVISIYLFFLPSFFCIYFCNLVEYYEQEATYDPRTNQYPSSSLLLMYFLYVSLAYQFHWCYTEIIWIAFPQACWINLFHSCSVYGTTLRTERYFSFLSFSKQNLKKINKSNLIFINENEQWIQYTSQHESKEQSKGGRSVQHTAKGTSHSSLCSTKKNNKNVIHTPIYTRPVLESIAEVRLQRFAPSSIFKFLLYFILIFVEGHHNRE